MVGARSLAMALNRLIDREIDARNPRTADASSRRGALPTWQVRRFCAVSLAVFLVAVFQLDARRPLAAGRSPSSASSSTRI